MDGASPGHATTARPDGVARLLELFGVLAVLACLCVFLLRSYSLIVLSDPLRWYLFGSDLADRFAETRLGYGFPLLMAAAIELVGPFRAYLVNLPVVIAVAALLYVFARLQLRTREPVAATLGGAAALAMLVVVDARMLLALVNPYRDALSYVFLLLSAALLIRVLSRPEGARGLAAAAGVALAAATSTRESSILMAVPFALYAVTARWTGRRVPLAGAGLAFAVGFGLACLPLLIPNQLVSGAALVPGQAAEVFAEQDRLTPGIRLAQLPETLPRVVAELRDRHGPGVLLLLGLGVVLAVWSRQTAVLTLSVPALCLYVLFYGAYVRRVSRTLFVADLFVFCIAAAGVAILADLILTSLRRPRLPALAALVLGFAGAAAVALEPRPLPAERLRLDDVERFVRDFEAAVPERARVVGMRPVTDLVRGFTSHDVLVIRNLRELYARLPQLFGQGDERVLLSRGGLTEEVVASGFDLRARARFDPADYGLQRQLGDAPIHVARVQPWSRTQTRALVTAEEEGAYTLSVDVGRLSLDPRSGTTLLWNGQPLAQDLADDLNHFAVSTRGTPSLNRVQLLSDRPLPAEITASLFPLRWPIMLDFVGDRLLRHIGRFSSSFLLRPRLGFPSIAQSGHIDVPTLRPEQAAYVVKAEIGLVPAREAYECKVVVEVGHRSLAEWTLRAERDASAEPDWREVSFTLSGPFVGEPRTRLQWSVRDAPPGSEESALGVRSLSVQRVQLTERLVVDLSLPRSRVFLAEGFRALEPRLGRWTGARAGLRLLLQPSPHPGIISVRYWPAPKSGGPAERPAFLFDGREVRARFREADGRMVASIPIEAGTLDAVAHRFEIALPEGAGRGILVDSVRIAPRERRSSSN